MWLPPLVQNANRSTHHQQSSADRSPKQVCVNDNDVGNKMRSSSTSSLPVRNDSADKTLIIIYQTADQPPLSGRRPTAETIWEFPRSRRHSMYLRIMQQYRADRTDPYYRFDDMDELLTTIKSVTFSRSFGNDRKLKREITTCFSFH